MAGYEANEATQTCNACPVGRFKHTSGEGPCLICPPHSQVKMITFEVTFKHIYYSHKYGIKTELIDNVDAVTKQYPVKIVFF